MSEYSVPADYKYETLRQYYELNMKYADKVSETYGQLNYPGNDFGSGRDSGHTPYCDLQMLEKYIEQSEQMGIQFNYLFNATCLSNKEFKERHIKYIISFLTMLYDIGVKTVTVCMPSIMELIALSGIPLSIRASTVCGIENAEKAKAFMSLGASRLVADESINRDFEKLKSINSVCSGGLELIVNVICNKNCIYRPFHHNQMSHDSLYGQSCVDYYSHRCILKRGEEPSNLLKMNFIRPEDIKYYESIGINRFKIQGRQAVIEGDIYKTVKAYFERRYDGDLLDLLDCFLPTNSFRIRLENRSLDKFLEPFYTKGICKNDCDKCNYCNHFIQKCLDIKELEEMNNLSRKCIDSIDNFKNTIESIMRN